MASFTLRQHGPRAGDKGTTVEIEIQKKGHNEARLVRLDTKNVLAEFSVDPVTGQFSHSVAGAGEVVAEGGEVASADPLAQFKRNWRVDGNTFYIKPTANSPKSKEIALPIAERPGPLTPTEHVPEIVGQPEMLFCVFYGIHERMASLAVGPTGTGKTTAYRWAAKMLNYNFVLQPISRGTEASHLVGEYLPGPGEDGKPTFYWTDGPVTLAVRLSRTQPTILMFDELNRIGNIAEFSRLYSLLDDSRMLELKEKRDEHGISEKIDAGDLYIGATSNPADDEGADYIGVQELDPALNSRFPLQPRVAYPPVELESAALMARVPDLKANAKMAVQMVEAAKRIRDSKNIRFPVSFRELEAWARCLPFFDYKTAAEIAVVSKAPAVYRNDIRNLLKLQG